MDMIWKDVAGYEGLYQVSNTGQVKRLVCTKGRSAQGNYVLAQTDNGNGYIRIGLCRDGQVARHYVHRLVAAAFLAPPIEKQIEINHKNGNSSDNRVENLEWTTRLENERHAIANLGKSNAGEKNGMSKLTVAQVLEIHALTKSGHSRRFLAQRFNVSYSAICDIVTRRRWAHIIWP